MNLYLFLLLASFGSVLGSAFVFERSFFSIFKYLAMSITIVAIPFLVWDVAFTQIGVWGFTKEYLSGYHIINLPLEEVLFFFVAPFSTMFIYFLIRKHRRNKVFNASLRAMMILLSIGFIAIGTIHIDKIYTSIVFISLGTFLLFVVSKQVDWFEDFFYTLILHYIPFCIFNGLLTNGLAYVSPDPVVWYNSLHITNIRITSIPIEDFYYSFLLILANVKVFEDVLANNLTVNKTS